ncbi:MAG: M15 family metallopeptidase [Alistipes sp.]|nr:M15 family metallopeptidase [Candidatus Minthomonas equi]
MKGKSFKEECTVPRSELRYLLCLHKDKDGRIKVGEMVLNRRIADDVLEILKELYRQNYPIERMRLVDYWDADDERSMRDNNSSSFNFRFITHTTKVSKHGLGLAVDINPLYNPYYKLRSDGTEIIEPSTAGPYLDRAGDFDYKIVEGDLCWKLFTEHGFEWGGTWTQCKDYQHFELQ